MSNKISVQRGKYFGWHQTVNQFYYTADDQAFFKENEALNHAKNLKVKTVDSVTRTEYNAWWATNAPAQQTAANAELEAATSELTAAQGEVDKLPKNTAAAKKAPYMKALNAAKARFANAKQAKDEADEAVFAIDLSNAEAALKLAQESKDETQIKAAEAALNAIRPAEAVSGTL